MKKINKENLYTAYDYIEENCESLYSSLFKYHFLDGNSHSVMDNLRTYQNEDGGFGHGLEPDFLLPDSSPMATTIAFQIIDDIEDPDQDMIMNAIRYYERMFDRNRQGWWAVPKTVKEYPHAPWWSYSEKEGGTVIDQFWGNPSSEIIGIMYKWRKYVKTLDINSLIEHAIAYFNNLAKFKSEHEVYCYLRMYEKIPEQYQHSIRDRLSVAIKSLLCIDESKWDTYIPKPLDFIHTLKHPLFSEIELYVDKQCDYLVSSMENGVWNPTWKWGQFEKDWEISKKNWTAVMTIKNYRILREFGRL